MREQSKDHILETIDVDLRLLDMEQFLWCFLCNVGQRFQLFRSVRVHSRDDKLLLTVRLGRLDIISRLDRSGLINEQWIGLWRHNRAQEGISHRDQVGMGQHPPARRLFASLHDVLAADLTKLPQPNHVVKTAVTLDVENSGNSVFTCHDFGDRNLTVLTVLALVNA